MLFAHAPTRPGVFAYALAVPEPAFAAAFEPFQRASAGDKAAIDAAATRFA